MLFRSGVGQLEAALFEVRCRDQRVVDELGAAGALEEALGAIFVIEQGVETVGGNLAGQTRVASVQIYDYVEAMQYAQAHSLSAVMLAFSFVVLMALHLWRPGAKREA